MDTGALLGGAASFVGNYLGAASQIAATGMTNLTNLQLAKYSYEQQKQMIREQNEYNSPTAQLARYQEAGLNPNLIYGEGKAAAGNQSEIAKFQAPSMQAPDLSSIGSAFGDAAKLAMAIQQNKADLAIKNEQAYNLKMQSMEHQQDWYSKILDNAFKSEITGVKIPLLLDESDLQGLRESQRMSRYQSESVSVDIMNQYHKAQTALANENFNVQKYFYENIQPFEAEIKMKTSEGISYENVMKQVESEAQSALGRLGAKNAQGLANILVNLIKSIIFGLK